MSELFGIDWCAGDNGIDFSDAGIATSLLRLCPDEWPQPELLSRDGDVGLGRLAKACVAGCVVYDAAAGWFVYKTSEGWVPDQGDFNNNNNNLISPLYGCER
jgi:hypothetical protein